MCNICGFVNCLVWSFSDRMHFLDFLFCDINFGIKTISPIFELVAGVKREFICD